MMDYENEIDLKRLISAIRRQFVLIVGVTGSFLLLALVFLAITTPLYTAKTLLFLDKSITQAVSENSSVKSMGFEEAAIDSEVEVIRSRGVTDAVIEKLKTKDYIQQALSEGKDEDEIAKYMLGMLDVSKLGETYVLSIQYSAEDPQQAADIANAYASTYIAEQLNALFEVSSRTVTWLQLKIDELNQQSINSQRAVSEYRRKYNKSKLGLQTTGQADQGTSEDKKESSDNIGLAELNNMQKEADTYKALYESYLEKLETINMQQSYPVTETRVITKATTPKGKSHPIPTIIVGAALILGAGFSILLALLVDNLDKTLKRGGQVAREIGVPFIGFFPGRKKQKRSLSFVSGAGKSINIKMDTNSVDDPRSLQSETIRTIRHIIESKFGSDNKCVIGVVSVEKTEGKSIVASNLALYTAQYANSILLDADIRSTTKKSMSGNTENGKGLADILLGKSPLKEVILHSKAENISILPSFQNDMAQTMAFLDTSRVKSLIDECKKKYDYIIVEFPPLIASADVYSFAQAVDCLVVVAEWGKTLPNNLNFHLRQNGIDSDKVIGVVLENANMKKMKKFYGHEVYS
ncbi:MAG: hypothetical protein DHS20C02_17720 [Micavibrio sp.]|nr:MAG: hypothetical protein DHS20C02_17720 [Micavibrio sp.]